MKKRFSSRLVSNSIWLFCGLVFILGIIWLVRVDKPSSSQPGVQQATEAPSRPAAMLPSQSKEPREPVRITDKTKLPKLIKQVNPVYPEKARKTGVQGEVVLEATIDIYGRVKSIKVLSSIPALDQAAVDAIKQWVYEPVVINNKPRAAIFTVTVRFRLK